MADEPPVALVDRAVATWTAARNKPDQIAQTVRVILLSPEFAQTWGAKVKRPFEMVVSFLRATGGEAHVGDGLFGPAAGMGQQLFAWPTPAGHPDEAAFWLGASAMAGRWNMPLALLNDASAATFRLGRATPAQAKTLRIVSL